ncbi:Periodic tryptophan protein 1 like protein [Dictyocoela muelleri]|nr:Periodic tryptophan protein 1 like protein [Dictyocoela muelleri]
MITSIGFLNSGIEIKKLEKYILDDKAKLKFPEYDFSKNIDNDENNIDSSDSEDEITREDILIYSTPNSEDQSFIDFSIYNEEIFSHHDIYVFDLIMDSCYFTKNDDHFLAIGTTETDVMIYNCFVRNPLLPQISLSGHTSEVTSVVYNEYLFSGSIDGSIIKWSIEKEEPILKKIIKNKNYRDVNTNIREVMEICGIDSNKSYLSVTDDSKNLRLYSTNLEKIGCVEISSPIEKSRLNDFLMIADSDGYLHKFDFRNLEKPVISKKVHNSEITSFDICENKVVTGSIDQNLCYLDWNFELIKKYEAKEKIFAVSICSYFPNICVFGGEKNEVKLVFLDSEN